MNARTKLTILLVVVMLLLSTLACGMSTYSYSNNAEVEAHSVFVATRAAAEGAPLR